MALRKSLWIALIIGLGVLVGVVVTGPDGSVVTFTDTEDVAAKKRKGASRRRCPPTGRYGNPGPPSCTDTDGDGIRDARDKDDDNDGIRDPWDRDDDGDRIPDSRDNDRDNDRIRDRRDVDDDGDGVRDKKDRDDDNDGIRDWFDLQHRKCSRRCR